MSSPTRLSAGKTATIWISNGEDKYGKKTYSPPFTISCTFDSGNGKRYVDSRGIEFIPTVVAWSEFNGSYTQPEEGDYIAPGNQVTMANPLDADSARPIKSSEISDCSLLNEPDDLRIMA